MMSNAVSLEASSIRSETKHFCAAALSPGQLAASMILF